MKTIVFIVHTEYHLLQTIGIIETYYKAIEYKPIIYRVSPLKNGRIGKINAEKLNAEYREFLYDYRKPNRKVKEWINEIVDLKPEKLFLFNEDKFWVTYLLKKLSSCSCSIVLAPDGAKVYNNFCISWKKYLMDLVMNFYFSMRAGLYYPFPSIEKKYASNRFINEVWVENPQSYVNATQKEIFEYHISEWQATQKILNEVFCFDTNEVTKTPILLYIDSSITDEAYYEKVITLLRIVQEKYPNYPLYIKCHQVSEVVAKEHFKKIDNVKFFRSDIPAELIIASLDNSILVSIVSTSMLFKNPTCKYMWFFPCFKENLNISSFVNPTTHIKVYSSFSDFIND